MVIKMIVGFYKSGQGQVALREVLGPLVKQVLDNKDLHINTNPVEIYKQWINAKELESGKGKILNAKKKYFVQKTKSYIMSFLILFRTVRNLHFLSITSTLISRENFSSFFG